MTGAKRAIAPARRESPYEKPPGTTTSSINSRSVSSCQTSRASPTRWQADSASRSSQEPGNWRTPITGASACAPVRGRVLAGDDLEVLDQRVGQQLLAQVGERVQVVGLKLDEAP